MALLRAAHTARLMREYFAEDWRQPLAVQGLRRFEDFWSLPEDWVEAPNQRRGGWSGVSRHVIAGGAGSDAIYVKRQENHVYRSWRHPWRGQATIARELCNLLYCQRRGVATLVPVYAALHRAPGRLRAILVTAELQGYQDLDATWGDPSLTRQQRHALLTAVARATAVLHAAHLQHNSLYPKHVFARIEGEQVEARFIDLEKAKWRLLRRHARLRDLDTLNRHWRGPSRSDRLRFLRAYLGESRHDWRRHWRALAQRNGAGSRRRP